MGMALICNVSEITPVGSWRAHLAIQDARIHQEVPHDRAFEVMSIPESNLQPPRDLQLGDFLVCKVSDRDDPALDAAEDVQRGIRVIILRG